VELLLSIVVVLVAAFLVGTVARFAVPGPDPMPVWLTIAVGLAGSFVGALLFGLAAVLLGGAADPAGEPAPPPGSEEEAAAGGLLLLFFISVIGATIVVVLYRKLVQKRPVTGPAAHHPPLRPRGLGRILTRRPHRYHEETASPEEGWAPDQLQKLVLLREAGQIDEEEYERRKAALVERL
jgi:uncharacterized membrane protein YeaQ/YmgE (transglycosylase-associated protein family)